MTYSTYSKYNFLINAIMIFEAIAMPQSKERFSKTETGDIGLVQTTGIEMPINYCCLDHPDKSDIHSDYNCSILTDLGENRCKSVYGGNTCKWFTNKRCAVKRCKRYTKYEYHYGKYIDVGTCKGKCPYRDSSLSDTVDSVSKCSVSSQDSLLINDAYPEISIIKDCECTNCFPQDRNQYVNVEVDKCRGNCNTQKDRACLAGVNDNFNTANVETPSPSTALLSGLLSSCSAGIQTSFDEFIDNRCFGHTFTKCFSQGECPLQSAYLTVCLKAANVPLTNTDSLHLGINGGSLWGIGLPAFNGGHWNQGDSHCTTLDLNNLPNTGQTILNDIQSVGHLDVMVQDDTAVDYLLLDIRYAKCSVCVPTLTTVTHVYSGNRVQEYPKDEQCDCVEAGECHLEKLAMTYYQGTMFETTRNVGQCIGRCPHHLRCSPIYKQTSIGAPEGKRAVNIINKCVCSKIQWNPIGKY